MLLSIVVPENIPVNWTRLLPTAREANVFTGVCHSVHDRPHGYPVTAHPCYGAIGTHPTGMLSCCLLCAENGSVREADF